VPGLVQGASARIAGLPDAARSLACLRAAQCELPAMHAGEIRAAYRQVQDRLRAPTE